MSSSNAMKACSAIGPARRAFLSRACRLLLAASLAFGVVVAPGTAMAWRADSDQIAGTRLADADFPQGRAPDIDAAAGILVDSEGRVLWSRGGEIPRAMASTTKIMTALLVLEHGGLEEEARVSNAAERTPYGLGLRSGERVKVRRLLELLLVASSNDAAYTLGQHVDGSMGDFVDRMNIRADELGLDDTHFANPHGLDDDGHYSSPADLAALTHVAMEHAEFRRIVAMKKVRMPAHRGRPARVIKSTDKLLGSYTGLGGVKTGFTRNAGHSFVGFAERDGIELTSVILGATSGASRFTQTSRLLDWGFRHLKVREVASAGDEVAEVPIASDPARSVPVRLAESVSTRVFEFEGEIKREASLIAQAELPVMEGQRLGEVTLTQGERVLGKVPAVAASTTISVEETVATVPVSDYVDRVVPVRTAALSPEAPPFDPETPVEQAVEIEPHVPAPVKEGQRLGEIVYSQGDKTIEVPVLAAASIEKPGFMDSVGIAIKRSWRTAVGGPTMATLEIAGGQ